MNKTQSITDLLNELNKCETERKRNLLLEKRGRKCISKSIIKKAREIAKSSKNEKDIIINLRKFIKMLKSEGDNLFMIFPKCYCHHIKKYKGKIPDFYCNCSRGWIKELFGNALGREVDVKIISTVIRGSKECRFKIVL